MGSALDARGIKSSPDNLVGHVEGIIENVDGVALITTIRVRYSSATSSHSGVAYSGWNPVSR